MFPSICKSLGLEQCKKRLDNRTVKLFSTECILEAIKITLDHSLTEFNGTMYRQKKGTAMGPKNAVSAICYEQVHIADTAMTKLDVLANEGGWDINFKPAFWARFHDDICIPWTHGLEKLEEFKLWQNDQVPGIKFTMEKPSENGIEFLDTFIYSKNGKLHARTYSKPCYDHTFLVPNSCQPTHNLRNIPYNTANRIFKNLFRA